MKPKVKRINLMGQITMSKGKITFQKDLVMQYQIIFLNKIKPKYHLLMRMIFYKRYPIKDFMVEDDVRIYLYINIIKMERLKRKLTLKNDETYYDFLAKIVIIGNSSVGKTNILMRFVDQKYSMSHTPTIGVDFKSKILDVPLKQNGKSVKLKLQLWDTAGQQRFMTLTDTYFKGASGVIVVYSLNDKKSFQSIKDWMIQIQQNNAYNLPKILVGNKSDLLQQRKISSSQGRILADDYNCCGFLQVSAKQNINIEQVFIQLSRNIVNNINFQQNENKKLDMTGKSKSKSTLLTNNNRSKQCCS